ncbi:FAD-dependent monooxygenase [Paucibacter sp. DJ2R-2]|uniref:FAD-dependent monooxygenase n=1 Tax=Paucibacter sp. DJ2R-2 TaxID=2893558 RepID=UPI0021E36D2C|nr:FAD-dependent monooxygenase [Paucibacter sp. DJ2R-2]MCV2420381.1 FAD-dependent monooxygenase [Paucibacter sp. DJ4R-1]MCV2436674.1 FAD-dependent monooxygenase [Paucibacter sp. DJ2R-2]
MQTYDVLVRGSGCVGRSLALALGAQGLRVALLGTVDASESQREDLRSYALNAASVALLRKLKVWDSLPAAAISPVYDMKIHGDAAGALLEFSAWSQGVAELAFIVDAAALEQQLATALRFAPHVQVVDAPVPAALTALCEGRASAARADLGVSFNVKSYGQRAIAARLRSALPHQGQAQQWFRSPDVLALLPIDAPEPGASYGLVWSLPEVRADEMLALDALAFEAALNEVCAGSVGRLSLASGRAAWPLALARAEPMQGPGWVLLGDAAHLVHPLAGQGLNLGLADVAALTRVLAAREAWRPLGDERLLRRYVRERQLDTWAMGELTDGLLRVFASEAVPLRQLRNRGLNALNSVSPLKRWLTARALGA